jgi:hypothetical protein
MQYKKPMIINLGTAARVSGGSPQSPESCMPGTSPANQGICGFGTSPTYSAGCASGAAAGDCANGVSANFTCLNGSDTDLGYECESGIGGANGSCTAGPSFA